MAQPNVTPSGPAGAPGSRPTLADGVQLAQSGKTSEALAIFKRIADEEPDNADAFNNLGILTIQSGDVLGGAAMFERAYLLKPNDPGIRNGYIQANLFAGGKLMGERKPAEAATYCRKILAIDPFHYAARVELTNCLVSTGGKAMTTDYVADPGVQPGTHVVIACMPKSGSSFLYEALTALTGYTRAFFSYAFFQNEQELYLPNMRAMAAVNTVTQQHIRATDPNIHLMQGFNIQPVLLCRNLYDIVMSLSDFYDGGAVRNTFFYGHWHELTDEEKRDNIIDHIIPWYLGFYASWRMAIDAGRLNALMLFYEDMIADKPGTLLQISDFLHLGKTLEDCENAAVAVDGEKARTRFNKGVAGRGQEMLSDDQKDRIRRMASVYRKIDFSPVGL